jgi:hypothetical protein
MLHTLSLYTARFPTRSHRCTQRRQISRDTDNFMFSILLKKRQNNSKTYETKVVSPK